MRGQERNRDTQVEKREEETRKRIPLDQARDILTVAEGKDPSFEYRFVNDFANRLVRFQKAGWEFVTDDLEIGASRVATPSQQGSSIKVQVDKRGGVAYLMRIKKEWYNEDQTAKQELLDAREKVMLSENKEKGMYGDINLERK